MVWVQVRVTHRNVEQIRAHGVVLSNVVCERWPTWSMRQVGHRGISWYRHLKGRHIPDIRHSVVYIVIYLTDWCCLQNITFSLFVDGPRKEPVRVWMKSMTVVSIYLFIWYLRFNYLSDSLVFYAVGKNISLIAVSVMRKETKQGPGVNRRPRYL